MLVIFWKGLLKYIWFRGCSSEKQKNYFLERIAIMLFAPREKGQGLVEYAIILALVAIIVIAVVRLLGPKVGNTFSNINSQIP
jgi:pilus assembly protein Flp/PilA